MIFFVDKNAGCAYKRTRPENGKLAQDEKFSPRRLEAQDRGLSRLRREFESRRGHLT